jgi:hypothetical protein
MPHPSTVEKRGRLPPVVASSDFNEVEQAVLSIAGEGGPPWWACHEWAEDRDRPTSEEVAETRRVTRELIQRQLVWMYRDTDGFPPLTAAEVEGVLANAKPWAYDPDWSHDVGLCLTDAGEAAYYLPPAEG